MTTAVVMLLHASIEERYSATSLTRCSTGSLLSLANSSMIYHRLLLHQNPIHQTITVLHSPSTPTLYLIGMKCLEPSTRRKAISLLHNYPCQEGMWEPVLVAEFIEEFAYLEEHSATVSFSAVEEDILPTVRCEDILEDARFSKAIVAATEDPSVRRLVCARFLHETTGELAVSEHFIMV